MWYRNSSRMEKRERRIFLREGKCKEV